MSADLGEAFAAAAAGLAGTPYRLHGCDPASGLDCVGLAAAALDRCGLAVSVPRGYRLRAVSLGPLLGFADANGFTCIAAFVPRLPGDLLLVRPSPLQAHLVVARGARGFVHAHAGLRRVVCEAGEVRWPVTLRWRLATKG
jgi:cell wall-associated NlpC family hydrolase